MKTEYMTKSAGFTLIELMIAMTILAMISLGVYDITANTFDRRERIEREGDFYNSIRVALDVLGRDITQLYTPMADALPGNLGKALRPPAPGTPGADSYGAGGNQTSLGNPTEFWGEPINKEGVRPSRLQGEETKLSFVASSHMRIYRDSADSELSKIKYTLEDPNAPNPGNKGKLLVKHENTNAFDDEERSSDSDNHEVKYALLEGIKSVVFEYLDGEKDTWHKRWDTSGMDHKGVYPAVIKITVEIFIPHSDGTFTVVQQYRPELPI